MAGSASLQLRPKTFAGQDLAGQDLAAQDVLRYASHSKLTRFGATSFGALDDLRRH